MVHTTLESVTTLNRALGARIGEIGCYEGCHNALGELLMAKQIHVHIVFLLYTKPHYQTYSNIPRKIRPMRNPRYF